MRIFRSRVFVLPALLFVLLVLTASQHGEWPFAGTSVRAIEVIRKTADNAAVNNSTTLVTDDHLTAALAANERVFIELHLLHIGDGTADFQLALDSTQTATVFLWDSFHSIRYSTADAFELAGVSGAGVAKGFGGSTSARLITAWAYVENGGVAATFQVRFAQQTATVVDTLTQANSILKVYRL